MRDEALVVGALASQRDCVVPVEDWAGHNWTRERIAHNVPEFDAVYSDLFHADFPNLSLLPYEYGLAINICQ